MSNNNFGDIIMDLLICICVIAIIFVLVVSVMLGINNAKNHIDEGIIVEKRHTARRMIWTGKMFMTTPESHRITINDEDKYYNVFVKKEVYNKYKKGEFVTLYQLNGGG